MNRVKYIFFDIGYTLVDEDRVWVERCKEQAETQEAKAKGISANAMFEDIQTAAENFKPQWKSVIEKYGFFQSAEYKSEYETLYGNTRFVLKELSKRFSLGIIANQKGGLPERLRAWKIDKFFATVISSFDYGFSKPDERLFVAALEKSGCKPHNAVMVGDRLDNDIMPANKLGFMTVRIKQGLAKNQVAPSDIYAPNYEVNNLSKLLALPILQ